MQQVRTQGRTNPGSGRKNPDDPAAAGQTSTGAGHAGGLPTQCAYPQVIPTSPGVMMATTERISRNTSLHPMRS